MLRTVLLLPWSLSNIALNLYMPVWEIVLHHRFWRGCQVKATHKYANEDSDELSFDAGDVIDVVPYDVHGEEQVMWGAYCSLDDNSGGIESNNNNGNGCHYCCCNNKSRNGKCNN